MYGKITPSQQIASLEQNQKFVKSLHGFACMTIYSLIGEFFGKYECENINTGEVVFFSSEQTVFPV